MRPRALALLLLAAPAHANAAEGLSGLAARVAWFLGAWLVVSIAATALVAVWFRARARANDRLSAEIQREDWLAATGARTGSAHEPPE